MEKQELIAEINSALAEEFEVDESVITPDASIRKALQLDSLSLVDLVALLEAHCKIKITGAEMSELQTFQALYDFVYDKVK